MWGDTSLSTAKGVVSVVASFARSLPVFAWCKNKLFWPLYETYVKWEEDDGNQLAASVAYYMALSFFPLMLMLLAIGGLVLNFTGWGRDFQGELLTMIAAQTHASVAGQVETLLASVTSQAALGGPLGILGLLLAAMAIFAQFEKAFQRIFHTPEPESKGILATIREILLHRLRAFLLLGGLGALVIVSFLFNMFLSTLEAWAREWVPVPPLAWKALTLAIAVVINWALFTIIYKALPKTSIRWGEAMRGGLVASIIWEIGRRLLAWIVIGSNYNVYGVVGAFIALMLWVYYAAASIFFGAEYVRMLTSRRK